MSFSESILGKNKTSFSKSKPKILQEIIPKPLISWGNFHRGCQIFLKFLEMPTELSEANLREALKIHKTKTFMNRLSY